MLKNELVTLIKEIWKGIKDTVVEKVLHKLKKSIYSAHKRFNGATIAVIGPPAAGKTTLLKVLQNPSIPAAELQIYSKTELEEHDGIPVDFKLSVDADEQVRFRFKIKKNSDVGGEQYIRDQHWLSVINGAAVIIYVLDATKLISDDELDYKNRVLADFDWLLEQTQLLRENFSIVLAVNKIDLLCKRENVGTFAQENLHHIDDLKSSITNRWPPHLRAHLKGGIFLSLLDPGIRVFTLNGLISCFVGEDLMDLYRESK